MEGAGQLTNKECLPGSGDRGMLNTGRLNNSGEPATAVTTKSGVARARWKLLGQALRQKYLDEENLQKVSVRRFNSFHLFSMTEVKDEKTDFDCQQWIRCSSVFYPEYNLILRQNPGTLVVADVLSSFDNTGNVCRSVLLLIAVATISSCSSSVDSGSKHNQQRF
ncbi:calmodulin-lysine N-methyltransferase [Bombina bombina]|uniref:calmodulin-lysine N-methyltransferase n=1 Tax=Bombina bombina TaxID=8345 RepID=UPI00235A8C96|nr:calmodulin-lysine N-methyltransferase [Bombina bombina]